MGGSCSRSRTGLCSLATCRRSNRNPDTGYGTSSARLEGSLNSQVPVNPGDWIFGDMDGVLVIPAEAVGEVLVRAEEAKTVEDRVRSEIQRGVPVPRVYAKYGRL